MLKGDAMMMIYYKHADYLPATLWDGTSHMIIPTYPLLHCGGKYLSHKFNQHLAANGTKQILTTIDMTWTDPLKWRCGNDTPTYNEVAERLNCVLLECTWAFPHSSALLKFLWGEAIKHTIWLKNRMATHAL